MNGPQVVAVALHGPQPAVMGWPTTLETSINKQHPFTMSKTSDEKQVRDFLSYMANPIRHVESKLKDGERINGHYMARVAEILSPWSDQAKAALAAFDRLHSLQAFTNGATGSDDVRG